MRYITLFLLSIFITTIASAKCTSSGIYCLSKSSTLNKNGLIILEFYASSQSLIPGLNNKYPIYLKSSKGKVPLNIIETLQGEMSVTQIVLKPGLELITGEIYALQIGNLPKHERKPELYNSASKKWEQFTFKITNSVDKDMPVWNDLPTEKKKTFDYFGCGPASWVYFNISAQDESELFARASVKNKTTGLTTTYILNIENGSVKVGHGMCSGAFHFDNGDNFEVTFQLFDQSGNKSSTTKPISFTRPTASSNDE